MGDVLLVSLCQRMKAELNDSDILARVGGDEFVAVLAGRDNPPGFEIIIEKLLQAASTPVSAAEMALRVSASIGVTIFPQDNGEADQLVRHADQAMYIAKQGGKNRYHIFDIEQDKAVQTRREGLENIQKALEQNELVLYYQPKVNMKLGLVTGVEALIRWQHPEKGLLLPDSFLPVIEAHSLSIEIGNWVIESALAQILQWKKAGHEFNVSVNIAPLQLQQKDFVENLEKLLAKYDKSIHPSLELEILETSAFYDVTQVSDHMHSCRDLGLRFALDDFGTGYSSLTYLKRLPAQILKIDRSFVGGMISDPDDLAIVTGIIGLARAFNRKVVAEGVETIAHGSQLLKLGCDIAQGFGIARPMPASEITSWIKQWRPDAEWLSYN